MRNQRGMNEGGYKVYFIVPRQVISRSSRSGRPLTAHLSTLRDLDHDQDFQTDRVQQGIAYP